MDNELRDLTTELSKTQLMSAEDFNRLPQGYLRFRFHLSIPLLRFSFSNEYGQCLLVAEVKRQEAEVQLGKGFTIATFTTESI